MSTDFFEANEFNETNGRGTMHRAPTIGLVVCCCDGGLWISFDVLAAILVSRAF